MLRKLCLYIIEKLYRYTYEPVQLDCINSKLIKPVPGLVIEGVQYYEFANVADMPEGRRAHYNYLRDELAMGADRELLNRFIDQLKEANNKADTSRIGSLLWMLEDIVNNLTTTEALFNIASLLYFDEQEDLAVYDVDYNKLKIDRFKSLPDKGFFFDYLLRQSLKISGEALPADIKEFLAANARKLQAFNRILGTKTESKPLSDLTR